VIAHIILFEPRADLTAAQRAEVAAALGRAAAAAPSVRSCRIGRRVTHGLPGYEQGMTQDFQFAAVLEFDDVDGLREYLRHPAHAGIGAHFTGAAAAALAYDYEIVSLDEASKDARERGERPRAG
jgi:hypothetical protein